MSNHETPTVILSAFADEAANQKTAVQQFSALAALGLQYYSIRFIDAGGGIKNVMKLTLKEIQHIRHLEDEYGLNVASLGSPIGKVKLVDEEDGTKNAYVPFKKYLEKDVKKACELAHAFETKLIRGFSFYPPKGSDPKKHLPQAIEQLGQIAETCHRSDLTFGLEIEANLVGQTGPAAGRDPSQGEPSGDGADIRRGQYSLPGLQLGRNLRTIPGHEAGHRLDAHQGLPARQATLAAGARRRRCPEEFRAGRAGAGRRTNGFCATFARRFPSLRSNCAAAEFPACSSTWNRTSKGAGSSAASADRTDWAWRCAACVARSISPRSTITSAISTISAARGF